MKTFNTYYKDAEQFRLFVENNAIKDTPQLLVQIFCAFSDVEIIQAIMDIVSTALPSCHIIGATTDGEILGANVNIHTVVISLTLFEQTTLQSYGIERQSDCKQLGHAMAHELISGDTRALITFVDGINTNGEEYLEGFGALAKHVTVAGGLAGDLSKFGKTYVFTKEFISCNGAVGVALNNPSLHVHADYNFNWSSIGKEMTVTKAEKNRVYTIDNKTAVETYAYYLGDEVASMIPHIGIEFPLMLSHNGISMARATVAKHDDGSITFAGNLKTGDKVHLGVGNAELILNDATKSLERMAGTPIESIFIYSCMARRRFLQEAIGLEIEPWAQIAPVCGFFTNGEFFTTPTEKLLFNQTMTVLALSEGDFVGHYKPATSNMHISKRMVDFANTSKALSHYINTAAEELALTNERLTCAIEGSNDGIWNWNLETNEIYLSSKFKQMLGYEDDEFKNIISACKRRLHKEDKRRVLASLWACMSGVKNSFDETYRVKHKSGKWVWINSRGRFFANAEGKPIRASGFHTDITDKKNASIEREENRTFLQSIINGIDTSVIVIDMHEKIMLANKYAQKFFIPSVFSNPEKSSYQELYYQKPSCECTPQLPSSYPLRKALHDKQTVTTVTKRVDEHGTSYNLEVSITPLFNKHHELIGAIEVAHDISEYLYLQNQLEVQKQHLRHLAQHDPLTGLPNRLLFSDRLSMSIKKARRSQEKVAVLFIDLDHFKQINDTLGHEFGDAVLKEIAKRFTLSIRESDTLARLGGDEFIVILDDIEDEKSSAIVAEKMIFSAALPIVFAGQSMHVSASIGIAIFPTDGKDASVLLQNADRAMYKAKEKGGNTYQYCQK